MEGVRDRERERRQAENKYDHYCRDDLRGFQHDVVEGHVSRGCTQHVLAAAEVEIRFVVPGLSKQDVRTLNLRLPGKLTFGRNLNCFSL